MSSNIGIIFENVIILLCHLKKGNSKDFLNWKGVDFCDIIHYAVTPLSGVAANTAVNNSYYQAVFVLKCNILITIYITTAKQTHIVFSWFS